MLIKWALAVYRGDRLLLRWNLPRFDAERVRTFLGRPKEEEIYGCYELSAEQARELGRLIGADLAQVEFDVDDTAFLEDYSAKES